MNDKEKISRLEHIVRDTIWMARRYAHMRRSYAPSMVNEAIDSWLKMGYELQDDVDIGKYSEDGDFGKWDPETQRFVKERG